MNAMRPLIATLILLAAPIGWADDPASNPILNLDLTSDPLPRSATDWGEPIEFERAAYRVEPGVGLRVTAPAMGPRPIALDFAWPIETGAERLNPQQIETPPVRFDAPPTFAAATYLR